MASLYFDLKLSNDIIASVSVRQIHLGLHAYEVKREGRSFRGTVEWEWKDEHTNPLDLIRLVLDDYWAIHSLTSSPAGGQNTT